jgi:hypothetical protein
MPGLSARITELEGHLPAVERRERDQYRQIYEFLPEENARLKRGLVGHRAERPLDDDAQLPLSMLALLLAGNPKRRSLTPTSFPSTPGARPSASRFPRNCRG